MKARDRGMATGTRHMIIDNPCHFGLFFILNHPLYSPSNNEGPAR
jgi:hypothetical protein